MSQFKIVPLDFTGNLAVNFLTNTCLTSGAIEHNTKTLIWLIGNMFIIVHTSLSTNVNTVPIIQDTRWKRQFYRV